jgi:predicted DNA-binding transcriptional regulator AlpA
MDMLQIKLIGIKDLAYLLDLKPQTIRNKLSNNSFPIQSIKICGSLRWDLSEVIRLIKRSKPIKN